VWSEARQRPQPPSGGSNAPPHPAGEGERDGAGEGGEGKRDDEDARFLLEKLRLELAVRAAASTDQRAGG
jgi:hypothetical protein